MQTLVWQEALFSAYIRLPRISASGQQYLIFVQCYRPTRVSDPRPNTTGSLSRFISLFLIHSFIHTEHLYSASSKEQIRGAPDSSTAKKSSLKLRKRTQVTRLYGKSVSVSVFQSLFFVFLSISLCLSFSLSVFLCFCLSLSLIPVDYRLTRETSLQLVIEGIN